ncbi:hypothetical protein M8J77_010237 [Diaphorina citri]|nr:hypothetical protein M8J77_010237 [Diaphorina citri]
MPEKEVVLTVLFFAKAKDLSGTVQSTITLKSPIDYSSLLNTVVNQFNLNPLRHSLILALNEEYLEDSQQVLDLNNNDCLAIIPPISGG